MEHRNVSDAKNLERIQRKFVALCQYPFFFNLWSGYVWGSS